MATKKSHDVPGSADDHAHHVALNDDHGTASTCCEILTIPTPCPNCQTSAATEMQTREIPGFKEVVFMSFVCDQCGYRSTGIQPGGAIPERGSRFTLEAFSKEDLNRDVLLAQTAEVAIPEIQLQCTYCAPESGVYTTVEGLLKRIYDRLHPMVSTPPMKDSSSSVDSTPIDRDTTGCTDCAMTTFLEKLEAIHSGRQLPFTLVVSDPLANSFIGTTCRDIIAEEDDSIEGRNRASSVLQVTKFERSFEQNEALGLNDMRL